VFDVLLGLLDAGRLTRPGGQSLDARHLVVALTTSGASDRLLERVGATVLHDRWTVQRACAEHLRSEGLPAELVARIGAFAVYSALESSESRRGVAHAAIVALGHEYGLLVGNVDPVVLDVVQDIAGDAEATGARALHHAARELLAESFAEFAVDGPQQRVDVQAGPPIGVRLGRRARDPAA
jgi:ATP-dependent Clp protease ATP-binding subunit ClpA